MSVVAESKFICHTTGYAGGESELQIVSSLPWPNVRQVRIETRERHAFEKADLLSALVCLPLADQKHHPQLDIFLQAECLPS